MALTLRLSPTLQAAAAAYAEAAGLSLNALVSVALADYVQLRAPGAAPAPVGAPTPARPAKAAYRAPKRRTDPCPCGAVRPDGKRATWKHCHGKPGAAS
jgi:hypothetical protein